MTENSQSLSDRAERERAERVREGYVLAHEAGGHARYDNQIEGCPMCFAPPLCVGCEERPGVHGEGYCDNCWFSDEQREIAGLNAEVERLRERVGSLMLGEPSKSVGLYAAIDELQCEIKRLRAENEALMRWVHTDHRLSSFEDCQACAALRAHLNEGEAT